MDSSVELPLLAARSSEGFSISHGPPQFKESVKFTRENAKAFRVMEFSRDGKLLAYCDGQKVSVVSLPSCEVVTEISKPRTSILNFSPLGNILVTWETYTAQGETQEANTNLHIWDVKSGKCVRSLIQKQQISKLIQWSNDEKLAARKVNNEVHFFENNDFNNICNKLHMQKIADFSLSPGAGPSYHLACYVPGAKAQPSFVRLFKYPYFEGPGAVIANKSFFKADKVEFYWSKNGQGLLMMTSTDIDKSGASYYGEQMLHYLNVRGESCMVQLAKNGPIYSLEWNPASTRFCVVYGYMPAKATIYDLKCNPVFDFGTGPRNSVSYNVHGSLLILYGFGNLRGNMEIWDTDKHKLVVQKTASDSTYLEWSPDGIHIVTATTSPRLRVGNGYKIWHYTGSILHEHKCGEGVDLYEVTWQNMMEGSFKPQVISYKPVPGIEPTVPEASKQAYVPPSARGNPHQISRIREQYEPPSNAKSTSSESLSKNATRSKKRKEAKKAKKSQEPTQSDGDAVKPSSAILETSLANSFQLTGDPEKDRKIKNFKKKLDAIEKLKQQQEEGKVLDINQITKLKTENDVITELEKLTVI